MPSTALRQEVLARARRIVVKVGSQLLTNKAGVLDTRYMRRIGDQLAALIGRGYDVTVVSSGAIAVGCRTLGLDRRPRDIATLQAVAAVGQSGLMKRWGAVFAKHHVEVAQMLLTRGDFEDRNRYLNIRNCIGELHRIGAVPIINENDNVAVEELRLGDNDILAALVTNALPADALLLLSVVDGLHDAYGSPLEVVPDTLAARELVIEATSNLGTGGMRTKLEAARMVTEAGEIAVIANGRRQDAVLRIVAGENLGTVFMPGKRKIGSRRRWIGGAVRPAGVIVIDDGAARALSRQNRSLLATGITDVVGRFAKGDVVVIRDQRGREVARGLINYNADETRLIMGHRSTRFEKLLGRRAYEEVIHRDNLVTTQLQAEASETPAI